MAGERIVLPSLSTVKQAVCTGAQRLRRLGAPLVNFILISEAMTYCQFCHFCGLEL
jgi:hypothetical protein